MLSYETWSKFDLDQAVDFVIAHKSLISYWTGQYLTVHNHMQNYFLPENEAEFLSKCIKFSFCKDYVNKDDLISIIKPRKGLKAKKAHELSYFLPFLHELVIIDGDEKDNNVLIVDVGAGKCHAPIEYLRTFSQERQTKFVAIEEGLSLCRGQWYPDELLCDANIDTTRLEIITAPFHPKLIAESSYLNTRVIAYCLHGCGGLSLDLIEGFVNECSSSKWDTLIVIGCCYQLAKRFLCADIEQRLIRAFSSESDNPSPSSYPLWDLLNLASLYPGCMSEVGKESILKHSRVAEFEHNDPLNYTRHRTQIEKLWEWRAHLGPVIESIVLYDRLEYLRRLGLQPLLVPIWPPNLTRQSCLRSPRNQAILVKKRQFNSQFMRLKQ